jgi:hypothetical protein
MPIYAVQRKLPGISMEELAGAQKAAIATSNKFSDEGTPVNEAASLPFDAVDEVLDLNP